MYKIYINETPLILCSKADLPEEVLQDEIRLSYPGKSKFLLHTIDMMEKSRRFSRVIIFHTAGEALITEFHSLYRHVPAAGGVVVQPDGRILTIFRKGFWDLPKGKLDPGENPLAGAIREVNEETGVSGLQAGPLIAVTHHTYREKKSRCLKHTWWYLMTVNNPGTLVPQTEEDIEQATWMLPQEFLDPDRQVYASLRDVVGRRESV